MESSNEDLDWRRWFDRWEAMQNCYVPQRLYRFDLMLRLAGLPREGDVQILDLGCGPGSLAFRALRSYPGAHVVAVDADPVMLAMGRSIVDDGGEDVQFVQADVRRADWWRRYDETFDLVVSATTLHWLNAESLEQLYGRVYRALKPGGWFMNSDHVACGDPEIQAFHRRRLHADQQSAFHVMRADDWDGYWDALADALGQSELLAQRKVAEYWEGTDDGHPRRAHVAALEACGFEHIEFLWQDLGEAVIGAKKGDG